jgi:hypothetical protein
VDSLTPAVLAPFADPRTIASLQGAAQASVQLEASALSLAAVTGELQFPTAAVAISGVPLTQLRPTRLVVGNGELRIADLEWVGGNTHIGAYGYLALATPLTPEITVDADVDLRMVGAFLPEAATAGRAVVNAAHGDIAHCSWTGGRDQNAEWRRRSAPHATDVNGRVTFSRDHPHRQSRGAAGRRPYLRSGGRHVFDRQYHGG